MEKQNQNLQLQIISENKQNLNYPNLFEDNPLHSRVALVKQLRQNGFKNLQEFKIKAKRGTKYPNLIQFKYHICASFKSQVCRDARGIVLDQNQNFKIIALPYYKFFNYDDPKYSQLKNFNFNNYKIYEKHDGSLCSLYFYNNQWHIASSGVPDGDAPYYYNSQKIKQGGQQQQQEKNLPKAQKVTFKQQFWRVFNECECKLPAKQDQNKTFVFQLMSTNVTIVVKRDKSSMVLHGVRNIDTLEQQDPSPYGQKYNWDVSKPFDFQIKNKQNPIPQILQITQKLDPRKQQGFILCDDKYLRLKIKNTNYVRIHWLRQLSETRKQQRQFYILQNVVLTDETQTFLTYCHQWAHEVQQILLKLEKMNKYVTKIYDTIKQLPKKQFALQVQKLDKKLFGLFFALHKDFNQYNNRVQAALTSAKVYQIISTINFDDLLA